MLVHGLGNRNLVYIVNNYKLQITWDGDYYFTTVGGSVMARFVLLEFEKEEEAEEFAGEAAQLNYFENGDFRSYKLKGVMLLAGEGDKEDTEIEEDNATHVPEGLDSGGLSNVCTV